MAYYPAGASTRQIVHYGQEINTGRFQQFDYGDSRVGNAADYDLKKITATVHLIYSSNDWMAAKVDVERLFDELTHCEYKDIYNVPLQTWNHLDFIFGNDAEELVYTKVLDILSRS